MTGHTLIIEARKRAGLTQSALAQRLGTYQSVVARWESGQNQPSLPRLREIVRATGFDIAIAITRYDDHDETLIKRELNLLPHERLSTMLEAVTAINSIAKVAGA
ncbi:MAG TPA: helix-turn-helix transcriptional regulator [Acidimicrobiia bacterium]